MDFYSRGSNAKVKSKKELKKKRIRLHCGCIIETFGKMRKFYYICFKHSDLH